MGKYRKKPVVVEAFQMTEHDEQLIIKKTRGPNWPNWLVDAVLTKNPSDEGCLFYEIKLDSYKGTTWGLIKINTLEGEHTVSENDWIIKGVKGELYPCKPDIFKMTYEEVK